METSKAKQIHPFDVRYWTAFTWMGIFFWIWDPFWHNYIRFPVKSFIQGSDGQLLFQETYSNISEMPFRWGWPFSYIVPDMAAVNLGTAPLPAIASWPMLGVNILLVLLATMALVYGSQKLLPRFSIMAMLVVMTLCALRFSLEPLLALIPFFSGTTLIADAIHFSPILVAILILGSQKFNLAWDDLPQKIWNSRFLNSFRREEPDFDSPEEVLAFASRLDHEGKWEEAVKIYRFASQKWPEQGKYIKNCVSAISVKQSTGR